jgi:predicted esterase
MRSLWPTLLFLFALCTPSLAQNQADEYAKEMKKGYDALVAKNYDDGIASMKRCLELVPNDSSSAYNLACAYSCKNEADTAFDWLDKSVTWGFGFILTANLTWADGDKDLDNIRADPRYAKCMEKQKAMAKTVEAYYSKPVVYIPEAIKAAAAMPLLVVLHDSGQTAAGAFEKGPWKKLADEIGSALILPSGKLPTKIFPELSPKDGMEWFNILSDYQENYWKYEKTVSEAVTAFKKEHKLEPTRVFIAGEGQGGMVAVNVALFSPGLYKGAITLSGLTNLKLAETKLQTAAKMGMKLAVLWDKARVFGLGADAAQVDKTATDLDGVLKKIGFTATVTSFTRKADDPEQVYGMLKGALDGFAAAAAAAPADPGATNK